MPFFLNQLIHDMPPGVDPPEGGGTANLTHPNPTGEWVSHQGFLADFADAILFDPSTVMPTESVHSVPSLFARPILFLQALDRPDKRVKGHPLNESILAEWRGLLAMFALKNELNLDITVTRFPPESVAAQAGPGVAAVAGPVGGMRRLGLRGGGRVVLPQAAQSAPAPRGAASANAQNLLDAIANQRPEPQAYWKEWWLVYCNGVLVGATSPWTMLYTPADYVLPQAISWRDNSGRFADPIKFFKSLPENKRLGGGHEPCAELLLFKEWLGLVKFPPTPPDHPLLRYVSLVKQLLEDTKAELAPEYGALTAAEELGFTPGFSPETLIQDVVYRDFVRQMGSGNIGLADPNVLRAGRASLLTIPERPGLTGIELPDGTTDHQIDFARIADTESGEQIPKRGGGFAPVAYVYVEKVFFPERLIQLPLTDKAHALVSQFTRASYAIPLTSHAFEYLDPAQIRVLLDRGQLFEVIDADPVMPIAVRLFLPSANGGQMTFERKYARDSEVIRWEGPAPAFGYWPDFVADGWKENLCAFAAADDGGHDFRITPLHMNGSLDSDPTVNNGAQQRVRIWRTDDPVLGFELKCGDSSDTLCGLVLRKDWTTSVPPANLNRSAYVAVDFGSSSTNVMFRETRAGNREPDPLPAGGRTKFLVTSKDNQNQLDIANCLYPEKDVTPPFRTLLYHDRASLFGFPLSQRGAGEYTMRFVYYPEDTRGLEQGLKWGGSRDKGSSSGGKGGSTADGAGDDPGHKIQEYLRGLFRYIAAEARARQIGDVNLLWSYPLSLPLGPLAAMKGFWGQAAADFGATTGVNFKAHAPVPESEAVCRCLAALKNGVAAMTFGDCLVIPIDVGGGSTDLGFWAHGEMCEQVSFKLAGNDILTSEWLRFPGFLADLYTKTTEQQAPPNLERLVAGGGSVYFSYLLNSVKGNGSPIDPATHPLPRALAGAAAGSTPWPQVRTACYLFFSGVAYYAGLHATKLVAASAGVNRLTRVQVYFGGRGSNFLRLITPNNQLLLRILEKAFNAGSSARIENGQSIAKVQFIGLPISYDDHLPELKSEVVKGLFAAAVVKAVVKDDEPDSQEEKTMVGDMGWTKNGQPVQWHDTCSLADLSEMQLSDGAASNSLALHFLETIRAGTSATELLLDVNGLKGLSLDAGRLTHNVRKGAYGFSALLQPVFATELQYLLETYISQALPPASVS